MEQDQRPQIHRLEGLRSELRKARKENPGKKAGDPLRALACLAVHKGFPISEVALAAGSCSATVKRWVARSQSSQVRVLPIVEKIPNTSDHADQPWLSFTFGGFTLRLLKR